MLTFDYQDTAQVPEKKIEKHARDLVPYWEHLQAVADQCDYADPEASIQLPKDESIASAVKELVATLQTDSLKYVVIIGIDGSRLGTMAIYEALFGRLDH